VPDGRIISNVEKAVFGFVVPAEGISVGHKADIKQLQIVIPDLLKIGPRCYLIAICPENRDIRSQIFSYQWFIPVLSVLNLEIVKGVIEKSKNHRPTLGTIDISKKLGIRNDFDRGRFANISDEIGRIGRLSYRWRVDEARGFRDHVRTPLTLDNVGLFFGSFSQFMRVNPASVHFVPLAGDKESGEQRQNDGHNRPAQRGLLEASHLGLGLGEMFFGGWRCWFGSEAFGSVLI
jgi:hypothetical protein